MYGGLSGNDILKGGENNDLLFGESGRSIPAGNEHNDTLDCSDSDYTLLGGVGFDLTLGGNGESNYTLIGGTGNDTLVGAAGADLFIFEDGFGVDVIKDFDEFTAAEMIDLTPVRANTDFIKFTTNYCGQSSADAVITDGANTITLLNVLTTDFGADDFNLVSVYSGKRGLMPLTVELLDTLPIALIVGNVFAASVSSLQPSSA